MGGYGLLTMAIDSREVARSLKTMLVGQGHSRLFASRVSIAPDMNQGRRTVPMAVSQAGTGEPQTKNFQPNQLVGLKTAFGTITGYLTVKDVDDKLSSA
jgi:hypothetical protein